MTLTITSTSLPFLAKPSTGWDLFSKPPEKPTSYPLVSEANDDAPTVGPRRAIANRGTEIFVARGNEVRVADLQDLKARQPAQQSVEGYREYKVRSFLYSLRGEVLLVFWQWVGGLIGRWCRGWICQSWISTSASLRSAKMVCSSRLSVRMSSWSVYSPRKGCRRWKTLS